MKRSIFLPAFVAAVALALTGCAPTTTASTPEPTNSANTATPTPSQQPTRPPSSPTSAPTPIETAAAAPDDGTMAAPRPLSAESEARAIAVADAFMRAYTSTSRPQAAWFDGVRLYLTPNAQTGYQYTNPAVIHAHTVTGARMLQGGTSIAASVSVSTDAGDYQVQLACSDGATWLVGEATPPGGAR